MNDNYREEQGDSREEEVAILRAFPSAPREGLESGVLLSDKIQFFATNYKLIQPFSIENLKPAAYTLTVGSRYSIGGKIGFLRTLQDELEIEPFAVAIIQTRERLNIPNFLIARWNIKVSRAYEGLMWVGGAQVDPGWSGFLSCPLYNLSNKPISLKKGAEIAVIDFVTTTTFNEGASQRYKTLENKSRLVLFEEYNPNRLESALVDLAEKRIADVEGKIEVSRNRIDTFTSITFAAITILVSAIAVIATRPGNTPLDWNLASWTTILAVLTALLAVYRFNFDLPNIDRRDDEAIKSDVFFYAKRNLRVVGLIIFVLAISIGWMQFGLRPAVDKQLEASQKVNDDVLKLLRTLQARNSQIESELRSDKGGK